MSSGLLVLVFTSIVDTEPLSPNAVGRQRARAATAGTPSGTTPIIAPANPNITTPRTQRIAASCLAIRLGHGRQGVTATPIGSTPTGMSLGSFVVVSTSIADTVPLWLVTKPVLPSGVIATSAGSAPTAMSLGSFVRVFTSIVETVPLSRLTTKAVLPSGVTATPTGNAPTAMSLGSFIPVFRSIVDTVLLALLVTKAVLPSGVSATSMGLLPTTTSEGRVVLLFASIVETELPAGPGTKLSPRLAAATSAGLPLCVIATPFGLPPTGMSLGFLVLVLTSIVDTVPLSLLVTYAVLPFGVIATQNARDPTAMSVGSVVFVFTSIVETVPRALLVTKAVLPSGVPATPNGEAPTAMSLGSFVRVLTSIVDTVPLPTLATNAVSRHRLRAGAHDTPVAGTTPTTAPANPNTTTPRTHCITASCLAIRLGHRRHGVTATPSASVPMVMSVGFLVLVVTSMVDTVPLPLLTTKAVLPSGVIATAAGVVPTVMSVGFLVLVLTSIVDTVSLP